MIGCTALFSLDAHDGNVGGEGGEGGAGGSDARDDGEVRGDGGEGADGGGTGPGTDGGALPLVGVPCSARSAEPGWDKYWFCADFDDQTYVAAAPPWTSKESDPSGLVKLELTGTSDASSPNALRTSVDANTAAGPLYASVYKTFGAGFLTSVSSMIVEMDLRVGSLPGPGDVTVAMFGLQNIGFGVVLDATGGLALSQQAPLGTTPVRFPVPSKRVFGDGGRGGWVHVRVGFESSDAVLYVDDTRLATALRAVPNVSGPINLLVGGSLCNDCTSPMAYDIDDVVLRWQ